VNVAAASKNMLNTRLDFDDLSFSKSYNGFKTSLHTVHAKTVLTEILAEKFAPGRIDVNSFHPGMVRSELTRNLPFGMRLLALLFSPFMSIDSKNGIYVSASGELKGVSGRIFENKVPTALNFGTEYKETLWLKTTELLKPLNLDLP
jgi:NAD(P)-dependent dehydrogenase (short-subunit alcohol dehydrogenase family)